MTVPNPSVSKLREKFKHLSFESSGFMLLILRISIESELKRTRSLRQDSGKDWSSNRPTCKTGKCHKLDFRLRQLQWATFPKQLYIFIQTFTLVFDQLMGYTSPFTYSRDIYSLCPSPEVWYLTNARTCSLL